ncbi:hypothetical protein ABK01_06945 [Treponema sp. OMZ 305]|uniref:hypothetical protein n=1 Tax=Treponema sp. OMZ 305 TaxID=1659192 RepID=UPI0020A3E30F|nr:hypothetical protein [Treponema sp. OMZ 305]UTC58022.1 hypothetical protein ABK01_06945 [Treponema sp. OMZ 305]
MKQIFKYIFLQRKQSILLHCALMACMSGVELLFLTMTNDVTNGFYHFWFVLTMLALAVIPLSSFIRCSSGYGRSLLFTDESYLMLTLPVRTEWIVLGRMLCGLVEFCIYAIAALILFVIVMLFWIIHYMGFHFRDLFQLNIELLNTILVKNIPGYIVLLFLFIAGFILIGNITLAVQTIVRSFNIRRMRALWTVGGILLFMGMLSFIGTIETGAAAMLGEIFTINIYGIHHYAGTFTYPTTTVHVPVVSILLSIAFGIGCFFLSVWLLKKKVEV